MAAYQPVLFDSVRQLQCFQFRSVVSDAEVDIRHLISAHWCPADKFFR